MPNAIDAFHNFEKKNDVKSYNLLKCISDKIVKLKSKKHIGYRLVWVSDTGVVVYNSNQNNNTHENYKLGNIQYDNVHSVNEVNCAMKMGKSFHVLDGRIYKSLRVGSVVQESESELNSIESSIKNSIENSIINTINKSI